MPSVEVGPARLQWHDEYPIDRKIGTSLRRASSNASSPQGYQSTGLSACEAGTARLAANRLMTITPAGVAPAPPCDCGCRTRQTTDQRRRCGWRRGPGDHPDMSEGPRGNPRSVRLLGESAAHRFSTQITSRHVSSEGVGPESLLPTRHILCETHRILQPTQPLVLFCGADEGDRLGPERGRRLRRY